MNITINNDVEFYELFNTYVSLVERVEETLNNLAIAHADIQDNTDDYFSKFLELIKIDNVVYVRFHIYDKWSNIPLKSVSFELSSYWLNAEQLANKIKARESANDFRRNLEVEKIKKQKENEERELYERLKLKYGE
jgi:hypothetical protein